MDATALQFEQISVILGGVPILENVTAAIPLGDSTAILGPNGAGKTTLLQTLLGRVPYQGNIKFPVHEKTQSAPRIGYVPQRLQFDRGLPLTVMDLLTMGVQHSPLWLGTKRNHKISAKKLLTSVDAEKLETRMLGALSGGELQRVLLALALQQEPDLLILDEPSAGVDVRGGQLFCELLERLRAERKFTQLMVSHDFGLVTNHAAHVILLNRYVVAAGTPREVLTQENLTQAFGAHMGLAFTPGCS